MARLLITGARAPVALELARNFNQFGHYVIMTDSLTYPLARNTNAVDCFYVIPSPRDNIEEFKYTLINILQQEKIEYLIPTCEEVFYLAFIKNDITPICRILCPDFSLISKLHSKIEILSLASDMGILLPDTAIVDKKNIAVINNIDQVVVKREFCRFGVDVLLNPTVQTATAMIAEQDSRFLLQKKLSVQNIALMLLPVMVRYLRL